MGKVTLFCFAASYASALVLEVLHQCGPAGPVPAGVGLWGGRVCWHIPFICRATAALPGSSAGCSSLPGSWRLSTSIARFTTRGWPGEFSRCRSYSVWWALPRRSAGPEGTESVPPALSPQDDRFWGIIHAAFLFSPRWACVSAFLASLMYLFQARRLRAKVPPGQGLRLLSLERLEEMNRRAITLAFPVADTVGVLLGAVLMTRVAGPLAWTDPRVLAARACSGLSSPSCCSFGTAAPPRQASRRWEPSPPSALLSVCLALSHPVGQEAIRAGLSGGGR